MATRVIISPEAEAEAREAFLWYWNQNPVAALALQDEIERAVDSIAERPRAWAVDDAEAGTRRFVLARFPYAVIYRIDADVVTVVAVAHLKRRPGYWR